MTEPSREPADERPGWFGKVSSLGDFAHRRLPPRWVASCDRWLSEALVDSRARLGASWLETYLTAPVLGFAWTPGTIDERWWWGVLMASCDNVGRYFPLVIAQSRRPPLDCAGHDLLDRWYAGLASAALMTLSDADGSLDAMESALAGLPVLPTVAAGHAVREHAAEADAGDSASLAAVLGHWAADRAPARTMGRSAWWACAEGAVPHIVEVDGLPDGERFSRLLATAAGH